MHCADEEWNYFSTVVVVFRTSSQICQNFLTIMLTHCCTFWNPLFENYALDIKITWGFDELFISESYWNNKISSHVTFIFEGCGRIKFLQRVSVNFCVPFFLLWCENTSWHQFSTHILQCSIFVIVLYHSDAESSSTIWLIFFYIFFGF